jgi:endonuclease/exonuclease/phosphatase family metal-dependent hydrolase
MRSGRSVARLAIVVVAAVLCVGRAIDAQNAATLKVLDWNTHHGVGSDGVYNIERFVPWIASSGANVVSLNEVEKFTSWGNEDQPARYAAMLQAATGQTWHYTFAQRDGAAKGQGNLILTTFPIAASDQTLLSYSRSVARAQIVVNGVTVNLFSTHLDAESSTRRVTQMNEVKAWVSSFSQQHIIAGDFNASPGAAEIATMTAFAYDAWAVAKAQGTSVAYPGNEAGNTRNTRIDYVWYAKAAAQLAVKGARVFDTRDASGHSPSDHRPLMATFEVGRGTTTVPPPTRLRITIGGQNQGFATPTFFHGANPFCTPSSAGASCG